MASPNTSVSSIPKLSTDIYQVSAFVESIKQKYIDIPEDTLYLGVYGFLSSIFSNLIQNTTIMAAEYSQEAIPTRAKFERNIVAHALSLGINKIYANPAEIECILVLPETPLLANMTNNRFVLDKEFAFLLGDQKSYPYHLDYDIIIRRDKLPNGSYVYSARYDLENGINFISDITNPYLPAIGMISMNGDNMLTLNTTVRQVNHSTIYKKITVTNPLENKVINFSFTDQLAWFYVEVVENGTTHILTPVYEGLYDSDTDKEYINYMFLDESNIRLTFNRDSYQPRSNAEITVHIYTTLGAECNFELDHYQLLKPLISDRFNYDSMYIQLESLSDSQYGSDKLSIEDLKRVIPREALSRGSVTTYTDLNSVFNSMQTEDAKMYFLEKVHNQIERLYYSYLLLKDGDNIVPTNTITSKVVRSMFDGISRDAFTIKPGAIFGVNPSTGEISGLNKPSDDDLRYYDENSFLYMCPYLIVINKYPFYVTYYMTLMNYTKTLYFEYINDASTLQFVSLSYYAHRDFYTDPDIFKIEVVATQNINTDFQMVIYNDAGGIQECKFRMFAVMLVHDDVNDTDTPVRYMEARLKSYDEASYTYTMEFQFTLNDIIDGNGTYMGVTSGLYAIGTSKDTTYSIAPNIRLKLFYVAKLDDVLPNARKYGENMQEDLDDIIPGLEDYTLTNIYNAGDEGLDIFYDYTDLNNSYIEINADDKFSYYNYTIYKIPVVRYTYLNSEQRFRKLFKMIDKRRRYIQNVLLLLEDSFGIDYKFFNTYGPSTIYNIDNETNIDRVNLSLVFEVKFQVASEKSYITAITNSIKEYIEDMNYITDLHMPNLITYITNLYREQLVYIKFIQLNDYNSLHQSIYKNPVIDGNYFVETQTVPEFINVNTLDNDYPDIKFKIVE